MTSRKPPKLSTLWRSLRSYQIYGANTNVGKTIMSTILCKALAKKYPAEQMWYLKPVSTGPRDEADERHISRFAPKANTRCLFQFTEALSPHLAARSSQPISDSEIRKQILSYITSCAQAGPGNLLLETAGGVHSPTPSGSSQVDLYQPLRVSACLVADYHLGGISATISAFESLHIRGYDLNVVLQFENSKYQNHDYLREYFEARGIPSLVLPPPPSRIPNEKEDFEMMSEYYSHVSKLEMVQETLSLLSQNHHARIQDLEQMSTEAHSKIWYPFTQHTHVSPETIMPIDSASGDFFQTVSLKANVSLSSNADPPPVLCSTFDGSASWWTQGLGHGSPTLALAAAYAAGRYGHVMFAGTIHSPALKLANNMLKKLQNPRLSKVFFSDNGSTGMEVATKMALTATSERYGFGPDKMKEMGVIGLRGSYHGDTIGAMDCSEPGIYNDKVHWYQGRGHWLDFPQVKMRDGKWCIEAPVGLPNQCFPSLEAIYDLKERVNSKQADKYRSNIKDELIRLTQVEGRTFGAVIMEPVVLGAGGMLFADPLFQHILVEIVRSNAWLFAPITDQASDAQSWVGLPIVFDEVFTGLYRLGRFSAATFLQTYPDISVHAKLLTGGVVPLCCTVASESIYSAFLSSSKSDALLHGHSYTAHPIGCHVANTSLQMMMDMDAQGKWMANQDDWNQARRQGAPHIWSFWRKKFITDMSLAESIDSVVTLGSVLSFTLKDANSGYTSTAAVSLQQRLFEGTKNFGIHSRVLGNVVYLMASQTSNPETLRQIEKLLLEVLQ